MKMRAALLTIAAIACARAADPPIGRPITLTVGAGELLQFTSDVERVAISEPKIADAVVVSARDIMVNAKGPGQATLVVWETGGQPARYDIRVVRDNFDLDGMRISLASSLKAAVPDA